MTAQTGKAEHTPGKWGVNTADGDFRVVSDETFTTVAVVGDMNPYSQNEANARLIAAAPQLLEALRALLYEADNSEPFEGHFFSSRAAIEQARAAIRLVEED